jgi:SAM-dependent methyltransferase
VVTFICNVCGEHNRVERLESEPASCVCGSNGRIRGLIHLLSMELFGESLVLQEFPKLRAIRGLGMTDQECYAPRLAEKFDYTNTFYDRAPQLDFTAPHPELAGSYDFILSSDVVEHIAPPVERAFAEACRMLKPAGFFVITVFCNPADRLREHFPELADFRIVRLGGRYVLINRRRDGTIEAREDLIFHGGHGATIEMREFGRTALEDKLVASGFREVHFLDEDVPLIGVQFDHDLSQPLVARKEPFAMNVAQRRELINLWRRAEGGEWQARTRVEQLELQIRLASTSKWLRVGKKLGLGPDFSK